MDGGWHAPGRTCCGRPWMTTRALPLQRTCRAGRRSGPPRQTTSSTWLCGRPHRLVPGTSQVNGRSRSCHCRLRRIGARESGHRVTGTGARSAAADGRLLHRCAAPRPLPSACAQQQSQLTTRRWRSPVVGGSSGGSAGVGAAAAGLDVVVSRMHSAQALRAAVAGPSPAVPHLHDRAADGQLDLAVQLGRRPDRLDGVPRCAASPPDACRHRSGRAKPTAYSTSHLCPGRARPTARSGESGRSGPGVCGRSGRGTAEPPPHRTEAPECQA